MDGLGTYTCYCPRGYSGRFCEIAPLAVNNHFSYNSLCQSHACQNNGVCYVPKGGSHYMCQCAPGTNYSSLSSLNSVYLVLLTTSSLSHSHFPYLTACFLQKHSYFFFLQKHGKSTTYFAYYSGQPISYMYIFKKNVFVFSAISMKFFLQSTCLYDEQTALHFYTCTLVHVVKHIHVH